MKRKQTKKTVVNFVIFLNRLKYNKYITQSITNKERDRGIKLIET